MSAATRLLKGVVGVSAVGAACLAYASIIEIDSFRLRRVDVPILPAGERPIRILHLSDLHLLPSHGEKQAWVASLAALEPDLVVDTGDNLSHPDAIPYLIRCLGRLLDRPGVFVMGSNDYYAPKPKNPFVYFETREGPPTLTGELPWREMIAQFNLAGWQDLTQRRAMVEVAGIKIEFRGTDDGHLELDDYSQVAGPPESGADLSIGVTHAPYLRILDPMAADQMDLILAGHTHGGQVCLPFYGALVTNCDLDTKRVKGLSAHHGTALHVSGGLGTSPWAPIRFACPPEATLLTLTPPAR